MAGFVQVLPNSSLICSEVSVTRPFDVMAVLVSAVSAVPIASPLSAYNVPKNCWLVSEVLMICSSVMFWLVEVVIR